MGLTMPDETLPVAERRLLVPDEAATRRLAARLTEVLPRPCLVALAGDLGAGKTTFVKGVAAALEIDPAEVLSPTFGLIHEHAAAVAGGPRLVHADMYRLADPGELVETGWEEASGGDAWVFVEWPERIAAALPAERVEIEITIESPSARTITLRGRGAAQAAAVQAIEAPG